MYEKSPITPSDFQKREQPARGLVLLFGVHGLQDDFVVDADDEGGTLELARPEVEPRHRNHAQGLTLKERREPRPRVKDSKGIG